MGEAKKRRMSKEELLVALRGGHKPPENMANVSGDQVRALGQGVQNLMATASDAGLGPAVAAQVTAAMAVDFLRANFGDKDVVEVMRQLVERRMALSLEHWGGQRVEPKDDTPTS